MNLYEYELRDTGEFHSMAKFSKYGPELLRVKTKFISLSAFCYSAEHYGKIQPRLLTNYRARWLVIFFDNHSRGLWMRLRNSTRTKMAL